MDIPLPDDPPPPIKLPPIDIQLPPTDRAQLPLEIELPSDKNKSPSMSINLLKTETKSSECLGNMASSETFDDLGNHSSSPEKGGSLEGKIISHLNSSLEKPLPSTNVSSHKLDFVYSPSVSEHSQIGEELHSPVNLSMDDDFMLCKPSLEIDLPPKTINTQESDSQSSKFTAIEADACSTSEIDLLHFASGTEGNFSSKFSWDDESSISKPAPIPSDIELPQPRNLSPWEIELPTSGGKLELLNNISHTSEKKSFSEVKATLVNLQPLDMDIPMPDDPDDSNRYSPSLPVDDEPPLEIIPPQPKGSRQLSVLAAPPLPPLLPPSLGGTSTVLGRTKAKKRLMAFSMTKQGGGTGLSFALSKKQPPVSKDAVKAFDEKGEEGKKKSIKKGQPIDKARDTISEIEELKRKEMMLRENMQMLHPRWGSRDSHLYPLSGLAIPIPELVDAKKTEEIESLVGELLSKKDKKKEDRRSESAEKERHRSSRSKRSERDRERERRKRKPKTMPLDWKEFKKDGHKVHHFRRFKFEIAKLESKDKRRHKRGSRDRDRRSRSKDRESKKESKITSAPTRINLFETPMEIRKVLVALTDRRDGDLEFPEFLVKYTKTKPQVSYCENPRFATYHFMSRKEMLATVPLDIEEIIFKFLNSIRPKRLKVINESKKMEDNIEIKAKVDVQNEDETLDTVGSSKNEISEDCDVYKKSESQTESLNSKETNDEDKVIELEKKTEVKKEKSFCKKLHRNWFLVWKNSQLIPQYLTTDDDIEEEALKSSIVSAEVGTLTEAKKGVEDNENDYPSRKRNLSKSSENTAINEELEPIIRTAIRSKWDSDYEDSQEGFDAEKKNRDVPIIKEETPVTNGVDISMEIDTNEIDDDNLGVVPMDIVEERNDDIEDFENSFVEESEHLESTNVVEKLASEYEEFMKMVSFENKDEQNLAEDISDEVNDEYVEKRDTIEENDENSIEKCQSFSEYFAETETVSNTKQRQNDEDEGALIDKEMWETKRLYFNRSRSVSPAESNVSDKEIEKEKKRKLVEKNKLGKKKNKKKKVQASKIKKKFKEKNLKKKRKKYSSSESSSSSSSSDLSSDDSSSSSESSSSSDSSSEVSSSSSSDSSVDRRKLKKKKKIEQMKDKMKSKKNKKYQSSSSSENDDDEEEEEEEDKKRKKKKRKKKKVEKKKKLKIDKGKKLKDKKNKRKRVKESIEEEEQNKKVKKNKKNKKKEEFSSVEDSFTKKNYKKKSDDKKQKEKKLDKEMEYLSTKSMKRSGTEKEDSDVPKKKVRSEKYINLKPDLEVDPFLNINKPTSKEDNSKFEIEIDEDFKKSKEYRRMKKRELDIGNTTGLTSEFEPKSSLILKKSPKPFLEETLKDFEESNSGSIHFFLQTGNREKNLSKERSTRDLEFFESSEANIKKQFKDDTTKIKKLKDEEHNKGERKKSKSNIANKAEKKTDADDDDDDNDDDDDDDDDDDASSKVSSKAKKVKKDKKKKESDGSKPKKKRRKKKSKNSPKEGSYEKNKHETDLFENHIHFLRDENFLFELGKHKSNIESNSSTTVKLKDSVKNFAEKSYDCEDSCDKSLSNSKLKNEDLKINEDNSSGPIQLRNLEWHDDSETRGSLIKHLHTSVDVESNNNTHNSDLLNIQYKNDDDEKNTPTNNIDIDSLNNVNILKKHEDTEVNLYSEDSNKKIKCSPLSQFPSYNACSVGESDDESIIKDKENFQNRSPSDSSLGDIEIESQDNSFVLEKDLPVKNEIDISENCIKKGVFSEVSIKENEDRKLDNFEIQEDIFKANTNDSDRYSPTLDLDLLSPSSLTVQDKCGSDMSLDSNEPEDSFEEIKKSSNVLNMLDIPLPPPSLSVLIPSHSQPPAPCPAPVPPPTLRPHLVTASSSFKNILNIPPIPPITPQAETKSSELEVDSPKKDPIKLPLTNTRLTINKPLVKVKPANIFEDDDDESSSVNKNLIDFSEKEVQHNLFENDGKLDEQAKKKRSRWGMEPEDDLPIVKLYLANEAVKETVTLDDTNYNESQTFKEISCDTSLFDKEKSAELEKEFDDKKMEEKIVNEKRDVQLIDVSNIDVENAQEAWKDQENFSSLQNDQISENLEIAAGGNSNKEITSIKDTNMLDFADLNKINNQENEIEMTADIAFDKNHIENSNVTFDNEMSQNHSKKYDELSSEEVGKSDLRHERSKSRTDENYRRRDYSVDRNRGSRRRDSSRDRRHRRDSSRDRRDYSRRDRSRSKERRRDRYRRDSPDRRGKRRDKSRERKTDSLRDRKREKSPRRRDDFRESPRRRGDVRESPNKKEDLKESPKRESNKESPRRKEESRERKPPISPNKHFESESETSENEEENNITEIVSNIKVEPIDNAYEVLKENVLDNKNEEQIVSTKLEIVEPVQLETTKINNNELLLKTQKIKINFKSPQTSVPVPRKPSPLGFKRSLADSTSDSETIPVKKIMRTSVCLSPKRLSLDDRIELELGVKKNLPPPPSQTLHQTYYQIPVHDGSQLTPQVLPVPQQRRAPTTLIQPPRVDWDTENFTPVAQPSSAKSQVLQVGNILQVVPTEIAVIPTQQHPPSPAPAPVAAPVTPQDNLQQLNKVLQIGNMIQVVPTTTSSNLTPAQIFANAIANAVASVASNVSPAKPPNPSSVVKPILPVASVQPTVAIPQLSPEDSRPLPAHASPLLLPLPVAKKAITLPALPELDTRRQEKEKRKKEKEMRRQQKQKKATKKMIREALLMKEALESSDMENDDVRLSEEEVTDEEEPAPIPDVLTTPVRKIFFSPLPPPPGKGILVSPGFREKPVLATKPVDSRKVSFADGVHPGEGTSPSASEEHPHSPPPQPSVPKEKRYKKKKKKRKVKVRIIRVEEGDDDDDDEDDDDDGSPPPPPPGSPPPMFHYPPPPPGFMYAPPPSFTVLQGTADGQTFAPVYQQHHSSTTTTHTTTVQFAPPPPPPSKHARK